MHRQGAAGDGTVKIQVHEFDICMYAVLYASKILHLHCGSVLAARVRLQDVVNHAACTRKRRLVAANGCFRFSSKLPNVARSTLKVLSRALEFVEAYARVTGILGPVEGAFDDPACAALEFTQLPRYVQVSPTRSGNGGDCISFSV